MKRGMHKALRFLLAAAVVALLDGCASYQARVNYSVDASTSGVQLADERPADQKVGKSESRLITSCDYGSRQIGDDDLSPERTVILRSELARRFGGKLNGETIHLLNFTIHYNRAAELRALVAQTNSGFIPSLLNDQTVVGCEKADLLGGYVRSELTKSASPLVIVVDVRVRDRLFHSRHVEVPAVSRPWLEMIHSPEWSDFVKSGVLNAIQKLNDEIDARGVIH